MEFDDDPVTASIWHLVRLVVIAVLMNVLAVLLFAKAFPPQRHDAANSGGAASVIAPQSHGSLHLARR